MGRKKSKTPPPPKVEKAPLPDPAVESVATENIANTFEQEQARRQKRGAFVTKGQRLGSSNQVLGAGGQELADLSERSGQTAQKEKQFERKYYKAGKTSGKRRGGRLIAMRKGAKPVAGIKGAMLYRKGDRLIGGAAERKIAEENRAVADSKRRRELQDKYNVSKGMRV